ncbi:Nicotianamine synthase [Phaeosphaeriaceae sp. PMI808]|nr:Nicotianamine synthase [Phaeosphaeriaceae sp. PMI808]
MMMMMLMWENVPDPLPLFPYHANYTALTALELAALTPHLASPLTSLLFIGCGPLPLSSICMAAALPGLRIHNIDRDAAALAASRGLQARLGFDMTFGEGDVEGDWGVAGEWMGFDVVVLAALVGRDTRSKMGVLGRVAGRVRDGCLVVVRSARGLRGLLYPVCFVCVCGGVCGVG